MKKNFYITKNILRVCIVLLVFILPISLLIAYKKIFSGSYDIQEKDLIKSSFSARVPGESIRILDGKILNPTKDKEFVVNLWVKFRKFPRGNDRIVLLTKFDSKTLYRQGYGIAVEKNDIGKFRGSLFWQDIHNNGRWFTFEEIPVKTGIWYMFTLIYSNNKYLAMYYTYEEEGKVHTRLLGAHEVEALPASDSPFQVGSVVSKTFNGRVGMVSVISTDDFFKGDDNPKDAFKEIFSNPFKLPKRFSKSEVLLWTIGGNGDLGNNNFKIEKISMNKKNIKK